MSVRFQSISKTPSVVVGVLCLVLAGMLTACGGSTEVVVKVSDEEGSPIAGVSISQVGGSSDLGTTDVDGLVTIVPEVGDD
ncbi:MAG: hypothetical protein HKN21_12385, partial [Candidatus Eisenbacteria bacterium]|nr:hypothetical protein [Candidatus Eisenbacteria bacterium]